MATGRGVSAERFEKITLDWLENGVFRGYQRRLRKVAMELFRGLVIASPVRSGRFRGNWDLAIGAWPSGNPSPVAGFDGNGNAATRDAITRTTRVLSELSGGYSAKTGKGGIPEFIGIANNLPYGPPLEYVPGFSKKVTAGWMRATVEGIRSKLASGGFK